MATAVAEKLGKGSDIRHRIEQHMRQAQLPDQLQVDAMAADVDVWSRVHVLFAPLGPKHMLGNDRLPADPRATKALHELQEEWGTGEHSFPALIFMHKGTQEFKIEWAMVRPEDFSKSQSELTALMETAERQQNNHWLRSLRLVFAATTGARAPGDTGDVPLTELPGRPSL